MMKNKAILITLACVLILAFTLGVTGKVSLTDEDPAQSQPDRLIGVFITEGAPAFSETDRSGEAKLYARLVDDGDVSDEYVFEGLDGIPFFAAKHTDKNGDYWKTENGGISDANTAFNTAEDSESIELSGTLYTRASKAVFNPVYQTADGRVYMICGTAIAMDGDMSSGFSVRDEHSVTVAGKSETVSTSVELSLRFMDTPVSAGVVQFDTDGNVLSRQEYAAGELPEKLEADKGSAYIIVETSFKEGSVTRELFEPEDDSIFAFYCRDDGVCVKQHCTVTWSQQQR